MRINMKKGYLIITVISIILINLSIVKVSASNKEQLNQTSINLVTGRLRDYTYLKIINAKGYPRYKTSNKKVATVDSKGLVKAVGVGKCTITVKVKSHKYKCKVKVTKALSTKALKKKISVSTSLKDGYIYYQVSNRLNKPLSVTFYTSQCDNEGNILDLFFTKTIPAKSTQKWFEPANPDMVAYKITKTECEYTCSIDKTIIGDLEGGYAILSVPKKKAGIKIEKVHLETIKNVFGEFMYLYVDGKVYNKTPFDIHINRSCIGNVYIVFYKDNIIVYIEEINNPIGFDEGQNYQFKDHRLNISNWDYDYDRYEVIYNDGYVYLNY